MDEKIDSDEDEDVVFEKAREFLRIVQSRTSVSEGRQSTRAETQTKVVERTMVQFGVLKTITLKTSAKTATTEGLTPSQRRKLERVKTPVTSFRKPPTPNGLSEKEKEESVQKMLEHIRRMPEQETHIPPPIPVVFINKQSFDEDVSVTTEKSSHGVEFSYLTSKQELTTWKLLRSSPTNCNVFVGNLSYKVNESLLLVVFQPFLIEQQQQHLKVRIVIDSVSGASRGYGFVQFPYRRAAELAMICMQGFELFGREMQLGWGQEEMKNVVQPEDTVKKNDTTEPEETKVGFVISDSFFESTRSTNQCKKKRKTRWDIKTSDKGSTERFPSVETQSNMANTRSNEIIREGKKILIETMKNGRLIESPDNNLSQKLNQLSDSDLQITKEEKIEILSSELHPHAGTEDVIKKNTVSYAKENISLEQESATETGNTKKRCHGDAKFVEKDDLADNQCLTLASEATSHVRRTGSNKPIEWLTKEHHAKMIEMVCQNLRKNGVKHHLGVFGTHFEADNSRLFVLFCKQLTEEELKSEFEKYGSVEINVNKDSFGISKGSAIVQYVSSASAEAALKRLHGEVLGSKPLTIKIAEPKRTHKIGQNTNLK